MMTDRDDDPVKRSLAMRCEEAGKNGAARRKARFMASIANLETIPPRGLVLRASPSMPA